jgi:hypothetical protein
MDQSSQRLREREKEAERDNVAMMMEKAGNRITRAGSKNRHGVDTTKER